MREEPSYAADIGKDDAKAEKKRLKKLEETLETGVLAPWERYRALTDLLEQYTDLVEMADRKTRFALVILGAVNAVNLVIVVRPNLFIENTPKTLIGAFVTTYLALSLYLFVQAIGALRPRTAAVLERFEPASSEDRRILGLRFVRNMIEIDRKEYYDRWRSATFGDVNHELAIAVQTYGQIITSKYKALQRLYSGLMLLVFLTAGMAAILLFLQLSFR
jgi:hypothetical protein